jgi:ribonucleoside-diphosphate reductase alpha chain
MVQVKKAGESGRRDPQDDPNALYDLGYKIFLDRYAQKDMTRSTLTVGDIVIVVVDSKTGQREVGKITAMTLPEITIELLDGSVVTRDLEHVDKPIETHPGQMMDRVARGIASIEAEPKQAEWERNFRWLLEGWKFVPGGRILTGAGTDQQLTFYNCYVIPSPRDSRGGIIETLHQMTEIMSRGGGVGINISTLRPRQSYVKGVNGRSSGSVSWGALYSFVTGLIEQGGCFGPDERVMTNGGLIPAKELADRIDAGETFYAHTHKGLRRITARFRNGVKPLYEVTTKRGYKVQITAEHKVAVLMDGKITTMPLKYLTTGDEILLLLGSGVQTNYAELKPVDYQHQRSIMSTTLNENVRLPELLTEELAYLIGYMHGDGYVHVATKVKWQAAKAIKMATADAHHAVRERLVNSIRDLFELEPTIVDGDGACKIVSMHSRLVIQWLSANGLLKAKAEDIRVPEAIFRSPTSVQGAFIAGYFDADGCNRGSKGGYGIDCVNRPMLADVQQLLSANGIVSRISATDRSEQGWRTIYRLSITGSHFKQRFAAFVPAVKVLTEINGKREENTYPTTVWSSLGARSKYRQRIHDGVSERISVAQLERISERLELDQQAAPAQEIRELLNTLPDTIASIELLGDSDVYDFEVDDVHLLSGSGVYTSNSRRGALMLILNDWHPDVFDFINSKRTAGNITNANISVGVSDKLMEAVKADGDWELLFPDTSYDDYDDVWDGDIDKWQAAGRRVQHYKTVKAREVWNAIIESAWASAEPGVWFRERSNKMANSWYFNPLISTNPCGEQPLGAFSVCNLGAINLARFYDEAAHDVAWDDLAKTVRYATRFLDNVIDSTPYFFEQNAQVQGNERRVGLGTMGIAELMIKLGVRYGSDESVEFIEKLYKFIAVEAYKTSSDVATEKGAFPAFDAEKFLQSGFMQVMPEDVREKIRRDGIRNVTLLTQAPTGTTGTLVNTSTGIEPFFSWVYYRKSRLGLHEEQVPLVKAWRDAHPDEEDLPEYFVTAMDLAPEEHVKVQAAFQRWIDSAISKTCNVPNEYTVEQVSKLYEMMYDLGCKGGTIYRDGSRDEQVLMLKEDKKAEARAEEKAVEAKPVEAKSSQVATPHRVYPRPKKLAGTTVTCQTPFGTAYVTMNSDEHGHPFEVFITAPGKAGSDLQADAEGLGRMISLSLRTTDPHNRPTMLRLIIDQLRDIGGARSFGFGETRVVSLPDAVARAMEDHYFKSEAPQQLGLPMNGDHDQSEKSNPATPVAVQPSLPLSMNSATNSSNGTAAVNGKGHHPGVLSGADVCPSCANITLIRTEGCRKCLTCGYSEC